jgi:excisionase family DNA binding protein
VVLPNPATEPTISVERAGELLGVSRASAYESVRRGEIPAIRLGKRLVVPTAALRRMLGLDVGGSAELVAGRGGASL